MVEGHPFFPADENHGSWRLTGTCTSRNFGLSNLFTMKNTILLLPVLLCLLTSCSKHADNNPGGGGNASGHLFYSGYTAFYVYDLQSGTQKSILSNAQESHQERYDVTRDGTEIVFYAESLNSTNVSFTIYKTDGTVVKNFQVSQYVSGIPKWSADKSMIAVIWQPASTYPDKYVAVFNRDGQALKAFKGVSDYAWTSDGRLLMTAGNSFYLSNQALTTAQQIQTGSSFPDAPGQLDISRDDQQVAFVSNKHIWKMNLDGSHLQQLTSSDVREWYPSWSPDGSRLYFALDWSGTCLELRAIPSGGNQTINIDPHSDNPAPRILAAGNRLCSQSQPMVRP